MSGCVDNRWLLPRTHLIQPENICQENNVRIYIWNTLHGTIIMPVPCQVFSMRGYTFKSGAKVLSNDSVMF